MYVAFTGLAGHEIRRAISLMREPPSIPPDMRP
jgi:hypothetical protein